MADKLSRRDFLKAAGIGVCALSLPPLPPTPGANPAGLGRVTVSWIGLYQEPSFRSRRMELLSRDTLVTLLSRETSDDGPSHNPLWYRVADGYLHSGYLQLVRWDPQVPLPAIPPAGSIFEVSVPATRSYRDPDPGSEPVYRLYYQSTAWVEAVVAGADGRQWYRIMDDRLRVRYHVRAEHLRRVPPEELTPISPDVPSHAKRVEVSLPRQELLAYEADRLVLRTRISTGIPSSEPTLNGIPTTTPSGVFYIEVKTPVRHMGDGHLTSDLEAYELPGVPWVSFFHLTGVAFHGTYWHNDFGRVHSHGCVNMPTEEAKWLYRWTLPVCEPDSLLIRGHGSPVLVE